MFFSTKKAVVGILAALGSCLWAGSAALAETERFGVVAVQNDTGNVTIHYQIKIGDGEWVTQTLAPGTNTTYSHLYANQWDRTSPPTKIRFNSAIDNNPPFWIEYDLQRYAAPDRLYKYAKKYSFRKNDNNYFDLSFIN